MSAEEKRPDLKAEPLPITEMSSKPAPELVGEIESTSALVAIHEIGAHLGEDVRRALLSAPEPFADTEDQRYVAERVVFDPATGCWLFRLSLYPNGYGQVRRDGRNRPAHRVSFEAYRGPIPEGLVTDHLCTVRPCVNPWHLEPVTHAENIRRGLRTDTASHCAQGHPWAENTAIDSRGRRRCRACHREAQRRRRRGESTPLRADDTRCRRGHELTPDNTYFHPSTGVLLCRECQRANASRRHAARRAEALAYRAERFRALGRDADGLPTDPAEEA